jgi:hypothetical protein
VDISESHPLLQKMVKLARIDHLLAMIDRCLEADSTKHETF